MEFRGMGLQNSHIEFQGYFLNLSKSDGIPFVIRSTSPSKRQYRMDFVFITLLSDTPASIDMGQGYRKWEAVNIDCSFNKSVEMIIDNLITRQGHCL